MAKKSKISARTAKMNAQKQIGNLADLMLEMENLYLELHRQFYSMLSALDPGAERNRAFSDYCVQSIAWGDLHAHMLAQQFPNLDNQPDLQAAIEHMAKEISKNMAFRIGAQGLAPSQDSPIIIPVGARKSS